MSYSKHVVTVVAQQIVDAQYFVAFTGAGISTASGIPDFRGPDGVWTRREKGLPPKPLSKPLEEMEPNVGHYVLVELQDMGLLKFLISQNVDNLHLKSGIRPEILAELHGNTTLMKCMACDTRFTKEEIGWVTEIHGRGYRHHPQRSNQPHCPQCHGRIISSVVNFKDPMPQKETTAAELHSFRCDLMLVIGSSLVVYPAAQLPYLAKTKSDAAKLIILNAEPTPLDSIADLTINAKFEQFLPAVLIEIKKMFTPTNIFSDGKFRDRLPIGQSCETLNTTADRGMRIKWIADFLTFPSFILKIYSLLPQSYQFGIYFIEIKAEDTVIFYRN